MVGEVAGRYADFKLALASALEAGQRLQARLDDGLQQQLAEAEDDAERREIRDYYEMFRELHLEVEVTRGQPAVESDVQVTALARDRSALVRFLQQMQPPWEESSAVAGAKKTGPRSMRPARNFVGTCIPQ